MKTRRRNFSDDRLTITRRNNRSKKPSVNETTENSEESIPIDLIIEILSRLPSNSVARCRCVSKLCASILCRPYFTELFFTRSQTRPQILIAVENHGKLSFLSAPQPQNPDVNSSPICANELMHFPIDREFDMCGHVHGLFCFMDKRISNGRFETVPVICNPSTRQSLPLPKVNTMRFRVKSFFVYDPVDKQFKVLSMSCVRRGGVFDEHQILTIRGRGENLSWRLIECCIPPHYSLYSSDKGICINGVLYYLASEEKLSEPSMIVCFDVRSEKFNFITIVEDSIRVVGKGDLINYNGKLGSLVCDSWRGYVDGENGDGSIELWVLEDAEKMEWSMRSYVLPAMWQNILGTMFLQFVGMTRTNEIVFSPTIERIFSWVCYYNIERRTITKVEIQGMEGIEDYQVELYLDHVEDVKLM